MGSRDGKYVQLFDLFQDKDKVCKFVKDVFKKRMFFEKFYRPNSIQFFLK